MLWVGHSTLGVLKSCLVSLGDNYGGSVDCTTQLLHSPMTRPMFTSTNDSIHVIPWTLSWTLSSVTLSTH